jgi:hypothetical protein
MGVREAPTAGYRADGISIRAVCNILLTLLPALFIMKTVNLALKGGDANMGSHSCFGAAGHPVRGFMYEVIFA